MSNKVKDGAGVGGGNGAEEVGAVEETGIEEIGGLPAGFKSVIAEGEYPSGQAGLEEGGFVCGQIGGKGLVGHLSID